MAIPMHVVRLVVLFAATIFGLVALGVGATLTNTVEQDLLQDFSYAALAIASGSLTLLTVPAMIALELMKPGGFTSMIAIEVTWLGILSVLYLATGATGAQTAKIFDAFGVGVGCSFNGLSDGDAADTLSSICTDTRAITAFGFLNWIILMFYVLTLVVFSMKETGVWTSSVRNAPCFGGSTAGRASQSYAGKTHPGPYIQRSNIGGKGDEVVEV